jgi:hypothetical protein
MKVFWKQAMFGALLLLGVAAEGQDDNSNVGASNLECDDVILVSQGLIQHDRSLRDKIELFLDYKREVKQDRREGRIEVKEDNDESSFSRRFLNIFRHYYVPPTPPEENPTPAIPLHQAQAMKKLLFTSIIGLFLPILPLMDPVATKSLWHESLLDSLGTPMTSPIKRSVSWQMHSSTPTSLLMNATTLTSRV